MAVSSTGCDPVPTDDRHPYPQLKQFNVNGIELSVELEGAGPAVLLLHGWPDSAQLWRQQVPRLVEAGFRVVAPDLRGFGQSSRPKGVAAYQFNVVLADIAALLGALGIERTHVVGHDYGAAFSWYMATNMPDAVARLAVLSVGHPNAYPITDVAQHERAWYTLLFVSPVAEDALSRDDWALFRAITREDGDTDQYIADLSRPGALTACLNWYRANEPIERFARRSVEFPPVACPTMGIWSTGDHYLREESMIESGQYVKNTFRYERVEDASHWIPLDQPERISDLLIDFLTEDSPD